MNIKIPKVFIQKLLLGAVLIALSLVFTVIIKESLDTQDPESALPIINVIYDGSPIPDIYRGNYEWSFFTTREKDETLIAVSDMPLSPYAVQKDKDILIGFSSNPSSLRVWRTSAGSTTDFTEIVLENNTFKAPSTPGTYVYRIHGEWTRGYVEYYLLLDVE